MVALASVVGALFGCGGGGEVSNALSLLAAQSKYGVDRGHQGLGVLPRAQRPRGRAHRPQRRELPVRGQARRTRAGQALPDAGTVAEEPLVYDRRGAGRAGRRPRQGTGEAQPLQGMFDDGVLPADRPELRLEAGHVQRPRGDRQAHRERPPDRRLRPADRLLRAAAADAAGDPGPGHQRARRLVRGRRHVRRSSAAARTTPGARRPRRPGHHRHVRRRAVPGRAPHRLPLPVPRHLHAHGEARADERLEADHRRRHRGGLLPHAGLPHQVRPGDAPRDGRRQDGRVHHAALDLHARGRLDHRLPDAQRPRRT